MATRLIDISRTIANDALVYPGQGPLLMRTQCDIGPGCACRITALEGWTTHFLTHVDAPRHFLRDGPTLDQLPLERFVGPARVITADTDTIDGAFIRAHEIVSGENILFKTRHSRSNGSRVFDANHAHITECGARALVEAHINLVGIDYLSVDKYGDEVFPAHHALLGREILILEDIDLGSVDDGGYTLHALPLRLADADGSPVRAVLST